MLKLPLAALLTSAAIVVPATFAATDFTFEAAIKQLAPTEMPLLDITRAGDRLLAAGERGVVIVSDDKGQSWRQVSVPVSTTLTALSFTGENQGWGAGHAGTIVYTADGGETWEVQFDGNEANRQFLANTKSVATQMQLELDQLSTEEIEQSVLDDMQYALEDAQYNIEDAETAVSTGPADPFLDILMLDANKGFAVGAYGMMYRTLDGGQSWTLAIGGIDNADRYHYYAIASDDSGNLYLSGEAGLLYFSRDGGENWQRVDDLYEGSLFGVVTQGDVVLTFGLRGNIFRSTDQGESWQRVDSGQSYSLYGGTALDSGEILLFGAAGQVLSSTDGGQSFSAYNHPARSTFSGGIASPAGGYLVTGMSGIETIKQVGTRND